MSFPLHPNLVSMDFDTTTDEVVLVYRQMWENSMWGQRPGVDPMTYQGDHLVTVRLPALAIPIDPLTGQPLPTPGEPGAEPQP